MPHTIPADVRERIVAAATELYDRAERGRIPTVDEVRRAARTDMNSTSVIMREWRRELMAGPAAPVVIDIPDPFRETNAAALAVLWRQAQEQANGSLQAAQSLWQVERAELDTMRRELADAFEVQAGELKQSREEAANAADRLNAAHAETIQAAARAEQAEARSAEIERHMSQLRADLNQARQEAGAARERAAEMAGRLGALEDQNKILLSRLAPPEAD